MNKKELSIGSIIRAYDPYLNLVLPHEVKELLDEGCNLRCLIPAVRIKGEVTSYDEVCGLLINGDVLTKLGFVVSDKKGWKMMYYFGDMRLYWKYDKRKCYSTFKFMPDFTQKPWTRIECAFVHSLQNIMRFLTGGEMEFTYQTVREKGGEDD